ncbi:MAG: STAS domain-containing protein [Chloroflexi bacterium]|nr:STAS domain-containing protein [Chloroflexota bacterium]MBI3170798.1 STAS domain-containing protein [Chloroflexota bacterium]
MELIASELDKNITLIKLRGRLDIAGVSQIETKFAAYCSGEKPRVIVDISEVNYLASIGIRLLVTNAKSLRSRNGKMALLNPAPDVMNVLEITAIPSIIPVYSQLESVEAVLLGA